MLMAASQTLAMLLLSVLVGADSRSVPAEIQQALEQRGAVDVLVGLKAEADVDHVLTTLTQPQSDGTNAPLFEVYRRYQTFPAFAGAADAQAVEMLARNPAVAHLVLNRVSQVTLDDSVPQVNADRVWEVDYDGISIEGQGETICFLDTGIDTDHEAFGDRIVGQHCFCRLENEDGFPCCQNDADEDDFAEDDGGHGTHVAGIGVSDMSRYRGVAPRSNVVMVKVCNEDGHCHNYDIIAGIDWCLANKDVYNITVISISIGGGLFTDYCDHQLPIYSVAINAATEQGIPVVIGVGNYGSTIGIAAPACIENAIPVGAVTKSDTVYFNRGPILDTLAPGVNITSARNGGGLRTASGTSSSTPHVAGAIALIKQLLRLQGDVDEVSAADIEELLVVSGKGVYDPASERTYSRLDVLAALSEVADCNGNGLLDIAEIGDCAGDPACSDCNTSGILDACEFGHAIVAPGSLIGPVANRPQAAPVPIGSLPAVERPASVCLPRERDANGDCALDECE